MTKLLTEILVMLISHIPKKLPVGLTEFHAWADNIINKAEKFADVDSMKYVLATIIMQLDHAVSFKSDAYFIARLRKAAANQVAGSVFQEIKAKQAAKQEAANQVATTPEAATDGKTQDTVKS